MCLGPACLPACMPVCVCVRVRLECVCACVRLVALRLPAGKISPSFSQSSAHFAHTVLLLLPRSILFSSPSPRPFALLYVRQQPVDFSVPACAACLFISYTFVCTLKFPLFCPSRGCPCCCSAVYTLENSIGCHRLAAQQDRDKEFARLNFIWRSKVGNTFGYSNRTVASACFHFITGYLLVVCILFLCALFVLVVFGWACT